MRLISATLLICLIASASSAQTTPGGLKIKDQAPDFTAKDQNGKNVNLKESLTHGVVVLVFYRGEWCPYCNRQLKALEDSMALVMDKGAAIIAVSPENQENIAKTIGKTKATYSVVSDNNMQIMTAYKVGYMLNEKTTKKYKGYGIDLTERNGTNGNNLPVPAVYIIGRDGKITYSYYDDDYRTRVSVREILTHL